MSKYVFLVFTSLLIFLSPIFTESAKADDALLSAFAQMQMKEACLIGSGGIAEDPPIMNIESEGGEKNLESFKSIEVETGIPEYEIQSNIKSEIRTSSSGSRIVMPFGNVFIKYGYCHIFERHMQTSNGTTGKWTKGVSQFKYARFPTTTMDIIIDVINKAPLVRDPLIPGRATKTAYSSIEGQNVTVVIHETKHFSSRSYDSYDWIIISSYPKF